MPQQGSLKVAFGAEFRHQLATSADFRLVEDLIAAAATFSCELPKEHQGFRKDYH